MLTKLPQRVHRSGELTRSVATRQAQQDQSDLPSEPSASDPDYEAQPIASSDINAHCPAQTLSPPHYSYLAAQPGLDCPRGVGPVIAAPASVVYPDVVGVTGVPSVNTSVDTVQLVPEISGTYSHSHSQYQDSTVGFSGVWGGHDRAVQVSSQSHIHNHPSSMHGTQ